MDHALTLLALIEDVLSDGVPLAGGWLATRIETPQYPFGTIDMTSSTPIRGQAFYMEQHRGVISVWSRATVNNAPHPAEAFRLSEAAHRILGQVGLSGGGLTVTNFDCGALAPRNPDGITWGRSFTFTAITHEVG